MAYFAKTRVQYGYDDGTSVTLEPGDEITTEHGLKQSDLDTLLASDSIEEHDGGEWSGERPVGPLEQTAKDPSAAGTVDDVNLPEEPAADESEVEETPDEDDDKE